VAVATVAVDTEVEIVVAEIATKSFLTFIRKGQCCETSTLFYF
jgi:hypothetical protein